jgi:hypothetical protein
VTNVQLDISTKIIPEIRFLKIKEVYVLSILYSLFYMMSFSKLIVEPY